MWEASNGLSNWKTHNNPTTKRTTLVDVKLFLLMSGSFHLLGKKLDDLQLKDILKYECELYLKQPWTPPQRKIIVAYRIANHRLAIEIGPQSTTPISRDNTLCHFCSYDGVENETHVVLECPLYQLIITKFPSISKNVVFLQGV
jgi:hypothetical protein